MAWIRRSVDFTQLLAPAADTPRTMLALTFALSFRFHPHVLDALAWYIETGEYEAEALA